MLCQIQSRRLNDVLGEIVDLTVNSQNSGYDSSLWVVFNFSIFILESVKSSYRYRGRHCCQKPTWDVQRERSLLLFPCLHFLVSFSILTESSINHCCLVEALLAVVGAAVIHFFFWLYRKNLNKPRAILLIARERLSELKTRNLI